MKTNIKFTDTESDDTLKAYAETKLDSFSKFLDEKSVEAAVCYVEFRRSTKHQTGKVCTAEVTLEADGKIYRVTKDEPNLEKAIDKVKDDILQALRVDKTKSKHFFRKGGRMLKKMLQSNRDESL